MFWTKFPQSLWSKVHIHAEQEQLYLMLSSNSCQVEMALCNHEIYNPIGSGKQKTPSTTTSTDRYHPWAFLQEGLLPLQNLKPQSTDPTVAWIQSNKFQTRSGTNSKRHKRSTRLLKSRFWELWIQPLGLKEKQKIGSFFRSCWAFDREVLCPNGWLRLMAVPETPDIAKYEKESVSSFAATEVESFPCKDIAFVIMRCIMALFIMVVPVVTLSAIVYPSSFVRMDDQVHEVHVVMQHWHRVRGSINQTLSSGDNCPVTSSVKATPSPSLPRPLSNLSEEFWLLYNRLSLHTSVGFRSNFTLLFQHCPTCGFEQHTFVKLSNTAYINSKKQVHFVV